MRERKNRKEKQNKYIHRLVSVPSVTTLGKLAWIAKITRAKLVELIDAGKVEAPTNFFGRPRYGNEGLLKAFNQIQCLNVSTTS